MKLSWTEPWNRAIIRRRIREVSESMPSVGKISVWGGLLSLGVMIGVRWFLPEGASELTWGRMCAVVFVCSAFPWLGYLFALFPYNVHITEKGIFLQCGNACVPLPREQIRSISFEDRDGLHLLVIHCVSKQGKEFERTALTSPKYSDAEVMKFLFDAGMAHLCFLKEDFHDKAERFSKSDAKLHSSNHKWDNRGVDEHVG